jgi:molybdate transport system substrate-binding protein
VVRGASDIAVQQIPEPITVPGAGIVGPLSGGLHNVTTFSAGVIASSREPEAYPALIEFFRSPDAVAVLRAKGFEL